MDVSETVEVLFSAVTVISSIPPLSSSSEKTWKGTKRNKPIR